MKLRHIEKLRDKHLVFYKTSQATVMDNIEAKEILMAIFRVSCIV